MLTGETALEVASGLVVGGTPLAAQPAVGPRAGAALAALEAAVLPALLRPPCLVTFSGGVDSSLVLAVAVRVARRHGLPLPVPFSWRFPGIPATDERIWQDRVISSLRLQETVVETARDGDLDFVGPVARGLLLRDGVRHPANGHFHARPAELAAGGSLLTGVGGDQILSGWLRPENRTFPRRLKNRLPAAFRVAARRLAARELPWVQRGPATDQLCRRLREKAAEPVVLGDRARWHGGRRDLALSMGNLRALGTPHAVEVVSPLGEPGFVHALAHELGDRPAPRRSALVAMLARDAVPAVVWEPRRKARFGEVFLREHSLALARSWDGEGVDSAVVDADALSRVWSRGSVPLPTAGLLQQVCLARLTRPPTDPAAPHEQERTWTRT